MGSSRSNTFRKAIRHLKSNQIDEKLQLLSEIPTNNTTGIYVDEPEYKVQDPDVPGDVTKEVDFLQDDPNLNGRDTSGLFDTDGTTILTIEPPGDTSYILGPMASMWYAWGNFSTIGYIRQSDRRMVDLGRITGQLGSWNGSSNFTSYGQLTLEQAVWFRDTPKLNGADNNTPNYRAFYPGPPSNTPDQYGRYLCVITGTPKPTTKTPPPRRVPPTLQGFDPNLPPGAAVPGPGGTAAPSLLGDLMILGLSAAVALALIKALGVAGAAALARAARAAQATKEWWNKGRNQRIPDENNASWRELFRDDWAQRGRTADPNVNPNAGWDPVWSFTKGFGTGPTPFNRQVVERPIRTIMNLFQGYEYEGDFIAEEVGDDLIDAIENALLQTKTLGQFLGVLDKVIEVIEKRSSTKQIKESKEISIESRKRILREIKKPYILPEQPKVKYKIKPKASRTINVDLMKKAEVPTSFKKAEERLWGKYERDRNSRISQERKNEVLDHLGGSDHFWEYMTETSRQKSNEIMYGNFGGKEKKAKIVRKEELRGDTLLFIADENGKKESILQSELSIRIADEFNKELFEKYFKEQETIQVDNDPLFKKVAKRLKKEIDYSDKPSKNGVPNEPPPKTVNGYHPDFGKRKNYYNKLDPQSADSMPETGDAEIDVQVKAARKKPKIRTRYELIQQKNKQRPIDEEITLLDREMRKNKLGEAITNSTSGLYGGQDQEDTTQNTNTRIEDPDGGSNSSGIPYNGTYGNYDSSGTFTYLTLSGGSRDFNYGGSTSLELVSGDISNNDAVYKIKTVSFYGVSYLHLDSIWVERYGIVGSWAVKGRLVDGREIDLILGTTPWDTRPTSISFWSNNVAQPIPGGVRKKPDWYDFIRRDDGTQDLWGKIKDMLDAGKEWWDKTVLDNLEKKKNQIKDLIGELIDSTESVLDKIWDLSSQALDNLVGSASAADALNEYMKQQLGYGNYTEDRPKNIITNPNQAQQWSNQFDNVIRQVNPKDITNLTQEELDAINQGMSTAPYPWGVIFHNLGRRDAIKPLPNGGYEIRDNYLFDSPNDFEGGEIVIPSRDGGKITIGPRGPFTAIARVNNKGGGTHTYYDKDPKQYPDAKKIGEVVNMPISISLPPPTRIITAAENPKEEISMEIIKELLLEENLFDIVIERIKTFGQVTMQSNNDSVFKKVSKRLRSEIDYSDKPSKNGVPNEPPPKTINGYHPDLVDGKKVADRFNRLDPESAKAMPPTGNPHIDKKVRAARKKPK